MALSEEQIKNLKAGDPIIIHGTFVRVFKEGDILSRIKTTDLRGKVVDGNKAIHPSYVSLPEETMKHARCYEFKKGDIVREVAWCGIEPKGLGNIYEVEANDGTVIMLRNNPCNIALAPCFLELVYSAGKENTGVITQEELKDTPDERFKVISGSTAASHHKVEDTHSHQIVAYFPWSDSILLDKFADESTALKKAVEYCDYMNSTYDSEQRRQKL